MPIRKVISRSIATDVIVAEDIAANAITVSEISDGAVTPAKLSTGGPTWDISGLQVNNLGSVTNDTRRGLYLNTPDLGSVTGNAGVYLSVPYAGGATNNAFFRTKRGASDIFNGTEIASSRDFRILTGSTNEDTNERIRFWTGGGISVGSTTNAGNIFYSGIGGLFNGATPLLSSTSPSYGGVALGFDGGPNRGQIVAQNASTSQLGFYTKPNGSTAPQLRTLIDEFGTFNQYGKIYSNSGMPYNSEYTGTITTDGSGNATIQVVGWGWSNWDSYRKTNFVMMGVRNDGNTQYGTWVGLLYHGQGSTTIHTATYYNSSGAAYTISFGSNGSTGQRYFVLGNWTANTQYQYVIRGFAAAPEFIGAWGGV